MTVIKPDHDRRIEIPGVPEPVARPVDIDQAKTGFERLRTLRIYRFAQGSVIDGHAEEDEVFMLVLSGTVELTLQADPTGTDSTTCLLSDPSDAGGAACAAYLPPHAGYRLVAHRDADVAYARATPSDGPPPATFTPRKNDSVNGVSILLNETSYARRLHLRFLQVDAALSAVAFSPIEESEAAHECLIHVRAAPGSNAATVVLESDEPVVLDPWDSVAVLPGSPVILRVSSFSSALVLVLTAA
jgi:hypothetical protein